MKRRKRNLTLIERRLLLDLDNVDKPGPTDVVVTNEDDVNREARKGLPRDPR